jgi:hypothetical protein
MSIMLDPRRIANFLGGEVVRGRILAPGPGHSPVDRSLSVKLDPNAPDGFLVHSFAHDDPIKCRDHVRAKCALPEFKPNGRHKRAPSEDIAKLLQTAIASQREDKRKGQLVATYDYTDKDGVLLYQVLKYVNGPRKTFLQRRPDGNGDWTWALDDKRVLHRLPELLKYPDGAVFVAEGEQDADRVASLDHCATTVASGTWRGVDLESLAGRDIVILQDNDAAGAKRALAAKQLHGKAKTLRVVLLPDLADGEDVSDWLDADPHRADKLVDVCFDVPLWTPDMSGAPDAQADTPSEPAATPKAEARSNDERPVDLAATFVFVGDAPATPPRELIKDLLPADGVAVTGGQSTAGKTFIEIHKAVCLARPLPFFEHKIVERVGTAFIAAEGRALIANRFAAALAKLSIAEKLPIVWIKQLPDFSSTAGIKQLIRQLQELDKRYRGDFGVRLGQVSIDTVTACFGLSDEDDNSEATKVSNIMRIIGEEVNTLMSPVHHYGKNPESGLRGASAWRGCADVVLGVLADVDPLSGRTSNRELVCTKARDGEQGPISPFNLEFVELGFKDDGDTYGSCCVVPTQGPSRFDKAVVPSSKGQRAIQDAVNEALDGRAKVIVPRVGMVAVTAVKVADVREEFDRRYVVAEADPAKAANAKRMAFKRALDRLSPAQFGAGSAEGTDWIWKTT